MRTVTITGRHGALHRRGLTLRAAAREMFVRREFLKHMLETHGTCVVEHPAYLKAFWETIDEPARIRGGVQATASAKREAAVRERRRGAAARRPSRDAH